MEESLLLGPDGKPVSSQDVFLAPCPKCGEGPNKRVPSGGFGEPHYVCICGHEFKDLKCPRLTA